MKKVFGLVLGMLMFAGAAYAEEGFIKSTAQLTEAANLFKSLEQNKFAFKKNYGDKKILVAGTVEKVGEGRFDLKDFKSKEMPQIIFKGLFHAFLQGTLGSLDLAEINQGDIFYGICTQISEGEMGMWVKAICQPAMLGRKKDQKINVIWVTPDKEAQDFFLTPQGIEMLGINKGKK